MSETKAVFDEHTIQSLKNILFRYMEFMDTSIYTDYLNLSLSRRNSRQNFSIDMRPNTVKNCNFMSILYSQPFREYKKPTIKIVERV